VTRLQTQELPFSRACETNKTAILEKLLVIFSDQKTVLELGSGTGQHASWFAQHMPWLEWQPTDIAGSLPTLLLRCAAYPGSNLLPARPLDVTQNPWPVSVPSALYTANSLHIMPFSALQAMFDILGKRAEKGTILVVYGPFNYGGQYTSDSNARFDEWLYQQHPQSAIRDFERVDELANSAGFTLEEDHAMPANNRLLVWRRSV
jgi:hypothetical protein